MTWRAQGVRAWVVQRVSAVYLAVFIVAALGWGIWHAPLAYAEWQAWLARPAVNVATGLFFAALLVHAWVGMRDIVIDYVRPTGLRFAALSLIALALYAMAAWVFLILVSVVAI